MLNLNNKPWQHDRFNLRCKADLGSLCAGFMLTFATLMPVTSATAMERQPLEDIKSSVMEFIDNTMEANTGAEVKIKVGTIDPRLNLRLCSSPLEPFNRRTGNLSGNVTVGVRCSAPKPWTLYVPVEISVFEQVIASAHPLTRGQLIVPQALKVIKLRTSHQHIAYYKNPKNVIGMVASRNIGAGKIITPRLIQAPTVVKRGENVTLLAKTPHLTVRMKGKAMEDGAKGELIKVRNISSNRVIEGTVEKTGIVKVTM